MASHSTQLLHRTFGSLGDTRFRNKTKSLQNVRQCPFYATRPHRLASPWAQQQKKVLAARPPPPSGCFESASQMTHQVFGSCVDRWWEVACSVNMINGGRSLDVVQFDADAWYHEYYGSKTQPFSLLPDKRRATRAFFVSRFGDRDLEKGRDGFADEDENPGLSQPQRCEGSFSTTFFSV